MHAKNQATPGREQEIVPTGLRLRHSQSSNAYLIRDPTTEKRGARSIAPRHYHPPHRTGKPPHTRPSDVAMLRSFWETYEIPYTPCVHDIDTGTGNNYNYCLPSVPCCVACSRLHCSRRVSTTAGRRYHGWLLSVVISGSVPLLHKKARFLDVRLRHRGRIEIPPGSGARALL